MPSGQTSGRLRYLCHLSHPICRSGPLPLALMPTTKPASSDKDLCHLSSGVHLHRSESKAACRSVQYSTVETVERMKIETRGVSSDPKYETSIFLCHQNIWQEVPSVAHTLRTRRCAPPLVLSVLDLHGLSSRCRIHQHRKYSSFHMAGTKDFPAKQKSRLGCWSGRLMATTHAMTDRPAFDSIMLPGRQWRKEAVKSIAQHK